MKPLKIKSFHTILPCCKWDACTAFYRDILGFVVVEEKPGFIEFEVNTESRISLLKSSGERMLKTIPASLVLSFRVEDIQETHRILSDRCRMATSVKMHPWGAYVFELQDPEERRLEFWEPP